MTNTIDVKLIYKTVCASPYDSERRYSLEQILRILSDQVELKFKYGTNLHPDSPAIDLGTYYKDIEKRREMGRVAYFLKQYWCK